MINNSANTSQAITRKPVVLMTMGAQERNGHDYQVMTNKYIKPLVEIADCVPLLVPTCFGTEDLLQYLAIADGVYLTGAGTNIDPSHYGQENLTPEKTQDIGRDQFDLPLIRLTLEMGLPFFGVCRGMQELNIALGGSIHQKLYTLPGMNDHRENSAAEVEDQYAPAHRVRLVSGTWYAALMKQDSIPVNSLHGQGLDRLGNGVQPLAHSEDGLVEAVHLPEQPQFTLGVQWHPEWKAASNPHSTLMFRAFGDACRRRALQGRN